MNVVDSEEVMGVFFRVDVHALSVLPFGRMKQSRP